MTNSKKSIHYYVLREKPLLHDGTKSLSISPMSVTNHLISLGGVTNLQMACSPGFYPIKLLLVCTSRVYRYRRQLLRGVGKFVRLFAHEAVIINVLRLTAQQTACLLKHALISPQIMQYGRDIEQVYFCSIGNIPTCRSFHKIDYYYLSFLGFKHTN